MISVWSAPELFARIDTVLPRRCVLLGLLPVLREGGVSTSASAGTVSFHQGKTMSKRLRASVVLLAALGCVIPAFGWGVLAHRVIDQAAVAAIPDDGPVFLKGYADYIADTATVPDDWRDNAVPLTKMAEDPNHGWFMEQFAFMKTIPRSRYAFILALYRERGKIAHSNPMLAARMNVRWAGTLPYALVEAYGRLVIGLRSYREAVAQHRPTRSIETNRAFYVAWLGHYVGDGSQPLHDTIHHDGWEGPNPHGYTTDPRIHGRFETHFVDLIALQSHDLITRLPPLGHQQGDLFEEVLGYLDQAHAKVEEVYQLDQRDAFDKPDDAQARALVYQRTGAAAAMLRDLIVRAWRESARPPAHLQQALEDPANPAYDPDTGSAPPPRDP